MTTTDYLEIWDQGVSKGRKQSLILCVSAVESRVVSNSESLDVQWRGGRGCAVALQITGSPGWGQVTSE